MVLVFDLECGEFLMCLSVKMRQTRARAALVYIVKSSQVRSGQVIFVRFKGRCKSTTKKTCLRMSPFKVRREDKEEGLLEG